MDSSPEDTDNIEQSNISEGSFGLKITKESDDWVLGLKFWLDCDKDYRHHIKAVRNHFGVNQTTDVSI